MVCTAGADSASAHHEGGRRGLTPPNKAEEEGQIWSIFIPTSAATDALSECSRRLMKPPGEAEDADPTLPPLSAPFMAPPCPAGEKEEGEAPAVALREEAAPEGGRPAAAAAAAAVASASGEGGEVATKRIHAGEERRSP